MDSVAKTEEPRKCQIKSKYFYNHRLIQRTAMFLKPYILIICHCVDHILIYCYNRSINDLTDFNPRGGKFVRRGGPGGSGGRGGGAAGGRGGGGRGAGGRGGQRPGKDARANKRKGATGK